MTCESTVIVASIGRVCANATLLIESARYMNIVVADLNICSPESTSKQQNIHRAPLGFSRALLESPAAVAIDDFSPECDGGRVARELFDLPPPAEAIEQLARDPLADTAATESSQHEKIR